MSSHPAPPAAPDPAPTLVISVPGAATDVDVDADAEARVAGTSFPPILCSAAETRRALELVVQRLHPHPPPPPPGGEQREHLLLQVQEALHYVRPPASLRLGVLVLEAAAAERLAAGDADRAAVCADFADRFRSNPLDDDTFLAFRSRCEQWEGIAHAAYSAILADATRFRPPGQQTQRRHWPPREEEESESDG